MADALVSVRVIVQCDGPTCLVVPSPNLGAGGQLTSVRALSADDVWAVGAHVIHWDGVSWTVLPSPNISNSSIHTLASAGPADVWIAGASTRDWLIEHWDGNRWTTTAAAVHSTGVVNAVPAQHGRVR